MLYKNLRLKFKFGIFIQKGLKVLKTDKVKLTGWVWVCTVVGIISY